jgi:hypothetical protein
LHFCFVEGVPVPVSLCTVVVHINLLILEDFWSKKNLFSLIIFSTKWIADLSVSLLVARKIDLFVFYFSFTVQYTKTNFYTPHEFLILDICGATLLWRSSAGLARSPTNR